MVLDCQVKPEFETSLKPVLLLRAPLFGLLSTHSLWFRVQKPQDLAGAAPNFQMCGSESPDGRCADPHRASTWQMLQGLLSHLAKQHPVVCKNPQDLGKPQDLAMFPDPPPDVPIFLGVVGIEDLGADRGKLPDLGGT